VADNGSCILRREAAGPQSNSRAPKERRPLGGSLLSVLSAPHLLQDLIEVVAHRILHRRVLQPQLPTDRQDVPVVDIRGTGTRKRARRSWSACLMWHQV
jgi:hypothetical protein